MMVRNKKIECDEILELYDFLTGICDRKISNGQKLCYCSKNAWINMWLLALVATN